MASGARSWWIVGRDVMQVDDLGRRGECAVAVVALGAAQGDKMAIGQLVTYGMTGDAGDRHWRWRAGEALAFFNGILDLLTDGVAMAENAIV